MNNIYDSNENLCEEFLDENASVSCVKRSLNIDKNMSKSPFHSNPRCKDKFQANGASISEILTMDQACHEEQVKGEALKKINKVLPLKKLASQELPKPSKLQCDIKELLQKAIKIRGHSPKGVGCNLNAKESKPKKCARLLPVTMREIEKAQ
ncbi:unnamed protein product [Moneuplotes crassus]|uniref:Uncharacterized protein n=1 Tax=Euplotes crassus TaxID=5936 RepID=A0AAD1U478_EUPCR|nr:unnamed protein product [Moneuplotes crassus]